MDEVKALLQPLCIQLIEPSLRQIAREEFGLGPLWIPWEDWPEYARLFKEDRYAEIEDNFRLLCKSHLSQNE